MVKITSLCRGEDGADVIHRTFGLERLDAFIALYWWSDCMMPKLNSPERMPLTLATPPHWPGVALDLVIGGAAVEEAADGLARHVVDAGLTAGAYGHEALLRLHRTTKRHTPTRAADKAHARIILSCSSSFSLIYFTRFPGI